MGRSEDCAHQNMILDLIFTFISTSAESCKQDLLDLGVEVEFFPMVQSGSPFSIERFWGRVLPVEADGELLATV